MDFGYDPDKGLIRTDVQPVRYKAGPNPTSQPPLDPVWIRKLNRIADRIGAGLRWHWMGNDGTFGAPACIWGIQQKMPRGWQTVFCLYDELGQHEGNKFPFQQIDDRALREFCESSLRIKYGTGDEDEDLRLHNEATDKLDADRKAATAASRPELIANVIAGGDTKRFAQLLRHEEMHAGPGVRFQQFFAGADLE